MDKIQIICIVVIFYVISVIMAYRMIRSIDRANKHVWTKKDRIMTIFFAMVFHIGLVFVAFVPWLTETHGNEPQIMTEVAYQNNIHIESDKKDEQTKVSSRRIPLRRLREIL